MSRASRGREMFKALNRPDWRDPNMPVTRDYVFVDGSTMTEVDPEYERRLHAHKMQTTMVPDWRLDPTYNMRKR